MAKTILFLDIDDTLLAEEAPGPNISLRPGVVTQVTYLNQLFEVHWLTHWSHKDVNTMWNSMYANNLSKNVRYCDWRAIDAKDKAPAVLAGKPDFYWLEDPLSTGSLKELDQAGLLSRYIPVNPKGMWGFTRAIQVLFSKAGITANDLKKVGANPSWFREPLGDHFDWTFYE